MESGPVTDKKTDIDALEETMGDVVETLAVAEQAAEFVQATSSDDADRARAAAVRRQAEAMLDAAEQVTDGTMSEVEMSEGEMSQGEKTSDQAVVGDAAGGRRSVGHDRDDGAPGLRNARSPSSMIH